MMPVSLPRAVAAPLGGSPSEVLTPILWQKVDAAADKALGWLASQQQRDGSFPTLDTGQPGVTSLCVLAFAANGHLPGEGPYGERLDKAVQYILAAQKPNGLIALITQPANALRRGGTPHQAVYNHGISGLAMSELYGMTGGLKQTESRAAIEQAIQATLTMQGWHKRREADRGGWRYLAEHNLDRESFDSDLSVTGWQLMFLRSAKNAGFDVPKESIDAAVAYVRRCFRVKYGTFLLMSTDFDRRSRGMAGAGVLALAHAGFHNSEEARQAGDWILQHKFDQYNVCKRFRQTGWHDDRYHYGLFNCSQAMYQLGGRHWQEFFPPTAKTLIEHQDSSGSWAAESHVHDRDYGNAYTTALMVLALASPNQLLPIFQR